MSKQTGKALLVAATVGLCASAAAATGETSQTSQASQTSEGELRSASVRYDATEIDSERDAGRLFFRIRMAAEELCRISSHPVGYELWQERDCEAAAVAQAVRDAQVPELEEYYRRIGAAPDTRR